MAWPKGKPRGKGTPQSGNAGKGRKKGEPNLISRPFAIRMLACLDQWSDEQLQDWFEKHTVEAMRILASLERKSVEVSGPAGGPIAVAVTHSIAARLSEIYQNH